jgi:hypothetical protein
MTSKTKLISAALAAASVFATVPAVSQADYTFGSRLDHEPSNSAPGHNCREDGSDDATPPCTRLAIDQSFAVPGGLVAPMDGKIVRFRVRAGAPGSLTLRVAQYANGMARGDGTGPTVNYQGKGFSENEADVPRRPHGPGRLRRIRLLVDLGAVLLARRAEPGHLHAAAR